MELKKEYSILKGVAFINQADRKEFDPYYVIDITDNVVCLALRADKDIPMRYLKKRIVNALKRYEDDLAARHEL